MRRALALSFALVACSCAAVLGLADRDLSRPFEHRAHVTAGVSCTQCHNGISAAGDEGPLHLPSDESCLGCHDKPHDPHPCSGCHSAPLTGVRTMAAREHLRFSHASHTRNKVVDCARCHEAVAQDAAVLLPSMGTCLGCHVHEGGFRPEKCGDCHRDLPSEELRPLSHLSHGPDYSLRHGVDASSHRELCRTCHSEEHCARCHGVSVPAPAFARAFEPNDAKKLHRAGFRARHAEEARAQPGTCLSCHQPETCQSCHLERGIAAKGAFSRGPHPADWVGALGPNLHGPAARLDPVSCASCHGGAGESLCVSCHKVGGIGGSPHPMGWSSQKRSSELPCRLCHLGGALP